MLVEGNINLYSYKQQNSSDGRRRGNFIWMAHSFAYIANCLPLVLKALSINPPISRGGCGGKHNGIQQCGIDETSSEY